MAASTFLDPADRIVGIDGRSGSGKTAFAAALARELPHSRVLSLEDAYPGWNGLSAGLDHVAEHALEPLSHGDAGRYRSWDWYTDRPGPWVEVAPLGPGEVLLVEGCGAIAARLRPLLDLAIWCEAPAEVRRQRALDRDPYDWATRWEAWAAQENSLIYNAPPDIVVDTSAGDGEDVDHQHERVSPDALGGRDQQQHP